MCLACKPRLKSDVIILARAVIALRLAARMHGVDGAVSGAAKICAKKLPLSKRDLMFQIVDSRTPNALDF